MRLGRQEEGGVRKNKTKQGRNSEGARAGRWGGEGDVERRLVKRGKARAEARDEPADLYTDYDAIASLASTACVWYSVQVSV